MNNNPHTFWCLSYWSQTWATATRRNKQIFCGILLIHFVLSLWYILYQGVIFDEPDYFSYALSWAKGHPERTLAIMDSKTPMVAPGLLPSVFLKPVLPASQDVFFFLKAGRPFMYIYQLIGVFTIFCWASRLWGGTRWIMPVLFYCFDPLVFSYGMFIGSDMASTTILVCTMYFAWRYSESGAKKYWWLLCLSVAIAVLVKASLILCYPLLVVLFIYKAFAKRKWGFKITAQRLSQFVLVQLFVINMAYYFKGSFTQLGHIHFTSQKFTSIKSALGFANGLPVPLPAAFIQGVDLVQHNLEVGASKENSTYPGVSILSTAYLDGGLWYYYVINAVFKLPLFVWLLCIVFTVRLIYGKNIGAKLKDHIFLWLPFVYFLLVLSLMNKVQIGMRHAMILLPFLYIALGSSFNWMYKKYRLLFWGFALLHFFSIARYWPNMVAYTNELIWNKKNAHKKIRDSSLDYGQGADWAITFLAANRDYKKPTHIPSPGKFAITVSDLYFKGIEPKKSLQWIRDNFEPTGHYRYTILLYSISDSSLKAKGF